VRVAAQRNLARGTRNAAKNGFAGDASALNDGMRLAARSEEPAMALAERMIPVVARLDVLRSALP